MNNYNPLPSPHDKTLPRLSSWPRDLDHRQRKPHPQFVFQINLNVMQSVLLKLHPAKIMDVGCVAFHLLQDELDFGLRDHLLLFYADNPGLLPKLARSTAPARPDTHANIIYRKRRRRDHTEHAHERLHAVDFAADILTNNSALEIGKNGVGFHR